MNANVKLIVPAVLAAVALSACGSLDKDKAKTAAKAGQTISVPAPQTVKVDSIDGTKEVAYKCGPNGEHKLTAMYGFKNKEVVAAQVKLPDGRTTPTLMRMTGNNDLNAFWGSNVVWLAGKATAANVDKVDGNMLTVRGTTTVNGKPQVVDQIIARYCSLDKAATAKLNKTAAKAAKTSAKAKK